MIGVQTALIGHRSYYRCASGLNGYCTVDGAFGANTKGAVQLFQFNFGILNSCTGSTPSTCDGVVGPNTWGQLQSGNTKFSLSHPNYRMNPLGATVYFDGANLSGTCVWSSVINEEAYASTFTGGTYYRMGLTSFTTTAVNGTSTCF